MYKKRSFTLIEVIVSLSLITIIFTILFGFFTKITKAQMEIENIKKTVYQRSHLHIRLNNIFNQLSYKDFNEIPFYTQNEKNEKKLNIYINFDNGVDPDPNFSDVLKAKIFIDKKNDLTLEMYSKDKKVKTPRTEVLFTNVKNIECKFLSSKDLEMEPFILEKITNSYCWYNFWPKNSKKLPSVIYIKLDNEIDFAFFLPGQNVKIVPFEKVL